MPKDRSRNNRPSSRGGSSSIPGWVWLLTGIVTGAFIMFLVYLSGLTPKPADKTAAPKTETAPSKVTEEKPVFEFYDTLMNNEVIPPPSANKKSDTQSGATTPVYMLQVASFKKLADADSLKAQLTLEGLDASIAQFNNHGDIYHRVMVGPFTDSAKMDRAKKILAAHRINPIVLQKKSGA